MRWVLITVALLFLGATLKGLAVDGSRADLTPEARLGQLSWPPWQSAVVTVYFPEAETGRLTPVARQVSAATPEAALAELAAGPVPGRRLVPALPDGVSLALVHLDAADGGRAEIAAAGGPLPRRSLEAIAQTLGVRQVEVRGGPVYRREVTVNRLYFVDRGLPVPVDLPGPQLSPRAAAEALLLTPGPDGVLGMPPGISLDAFEVKGATAFVRLRFSPELTALVESGLWNFTPYYMGLVYTLTEFPEIRQVRFEVADLSPLARKQCRTPLAVPLRRPTPEAARTRE